MTKEELQNLKVPGEIDKDIDFHKVQNYYVANSKNKEVVFSSNSFNECKSFLQNKNKKKEFIILKQSRIGKFVELDEDFLKPFYESLKKYNEETKPQILNSLIEMERSIRENN